MVNCVIGGLRELGVCGIAPSCISIFAFRQSPIPAIGRFQRIDQIRWKPQRPANVTDRAARLESHEGAGHGGVVAAVPLIDVLDDLLAAQGVEVDVDIGQAGALLGKKTLEDQIVRQRVDRGDLQQVGHQRVGGRAAALAADALRAGKTHDVPDDQEVVGQPQLADHGQLVVQRAAGALTRLRAKAPDQAAWHSQRR